QLMSEHDVRQIPLVNGDGQVVDIALLKDLGPDRRLALRALVMAGGFCTRLQTVTNDPPKSMLPVGDPPLLQMIVRQLREAGIRHVNVATHYRAEAIERYFGDGSRFDLDIQYVNEDQPLGTAGALGLLEGSDEPVLVMNGDIVTQVSVVSMLDF